MTANTFTQRGVPAVGAPPVPRAASPSTSGAEGELAMCVPLPLRVVIREFHHADSLRDTVSIAS